MSRVQTNYEADASQNTTLAGLSVEEGQTDLSSVNNFIRQLMADIKQNDDEVRALIASAMTVGQNAATAAETAGDSASQAYSMAGGLADQISASAASASAASVDAMQAQTDAAEAKEMSSAFSGRMDTVEETAGTNAGAIEALAARVASLESSGEGAGYIAVDGETVVNAGDILRAIDVRIAEGDLASGRGQIGRTSLMESGDLDDLVADGWYAVGGEATGMPAGLPSGVCRVSSGPVANSFFQAWFAQSGESARLLVRSTVNAGASWTEWREALFADSVGAGLQLEGGVLSAVIPQELPDAVLDAEDEAESDVGKVLAAEGVWVNRATVESVDAVRETVDILAASLEETRTALEAVSAGVTPDGETVVVEEGALSVPLYTGAGDGEDGVAGLVPPASADEAGMYLKGDGTYGTPLFDIHSFDGEDEGLVPVPGEEEGGLFLRGDGAWADPSEEVSMQLASVESRVTILETSEFGMYAERLNALEAVDADRASLSAENQTFTGNVAFQNEIVGTVQRATADASGNEIESTYVRQDAMLVSSDVESIFAEDDLTAPLIASSPVGAALESVVELAKEYIAVTAQAIFASQVAGKANVASPALTGTPTAPTASAGTNTTQIATTAFVQSAVAGLVDSAPATLDTLKELSDALGGDANFASTVTTQIGQKLNSSSSGYVKGISVSGRTVTITFGDNSTATIQTQDTTYDPLSANDVADVFEGDF